VAAVAHEQGQDSGSSGGEAHARLGREFSHFQG
jgi:hypothetical protein